MFELNTSEKRILEKFILENKTKYSKGIQDFFDNSFNIDETIHKRKETFKNNI